MTVQAHAVITGGSSGIGLATAKLLAARGITVSIIARNVERLKRARSQILTCAQGGATVEIFSCDVGDAAACAQAVEAAVAKSGAPQWAIACAGIVRPGNFMDLTVEDHTAQIRTNYLGSLYFAKSVSRHMLAVTSSKLVFIASGAAFAGLFGYSAYSPSKFAVRGLAECLRVELKPHGISVTLVCPGDTNTPQLATELLERPKVTNILSKTGHVLSADQVAASLVQGAERGRFIVTFGWQLHCLYRLHGLIARPLRQYQKLLLAHYGEGR